MTIILLSRLKNDSFFKNIIPGDKKRVSYDNVQLKMQWIDKDVFRQLFQKAEIHVMDFMLCVWCDLCDIIHFKFLNRSQAPNAALYP